MNWWLPTAKALNRLGVPYPYLNRIACGSTSILTEIKFEVTDRCNLACTFCHQDFGAKGGTTTLDMKVYERVLTAAKNERIQIVRLTGGEPLVLKSIDAFLRRAKELGFTVIINTNGTALPEKRLRTLKGLVDYIKISLPAPDEETMTRMTGNKTTWRRKWEALERLEKLGIRTDILTVMTAENIQKFDSFIRLLEPHPSICWRPLRAETQDGDRHPVSRDEIRILAAKLSEARTHERWKYLSLGLATPFCALENPADAVELFSGGRSCGPVESLTVTSQGELTRCYSRRDAIDISKGLRKTNLELSLRDFEQLPTVCRNCPFVPQCRGGCRCDWSLVETSFGSMDYLADPTNIDGAGAFAIGGRPSFPSYAPAA
ncbi:MAG: radical SAM protein [Pseudolabrys sp.]|jgi:radical SAM protein with 4Fe4S-binding SPASM domain